MLFNLLVEVIRDGGTNEKRAYINARRFTSAP